MKSNLYTNDLTREIVDDFMATSGYEFNSGDVQVDPVSILTMIITPIVEQIFQLIGKRISERKQENKNQLTESEINEIKELVVHFEEREGITKGKVFTSEYAEKMAESVERVLRQNPNALLRYHDKK
jgi:hypothetical protein